MQIEKVLISNLKVVVRAYAKATGYSRMRISKDLYKGAYFLDRLFAGEQSVSVRKYSQMVDRMVAAWPEGKPYPLTAIIVMPSPAKWRKTTGLSPRNSTSA